MSHKVNFVYIIALTLSSQFLLCSCSLEEFWSDLSFSEDLVVKSPVGDIEGKEETTSSGDRYVAFRGIPYAKPPVGKLRFALPQPTVLGGGIFKAHSDSKQCPQGVAFQPDLQTSEDCLYLNIFTKDLKKSYKLKKVFMFIHGGGFNAGSAIENDAGSLVVDQDIITVVINYRLGILGFLSTGNEVSPGNFGLWDQLLALKWIKHNIRSFGGDENDITIGGESAGGAATTYLSLSPFSRNLFTKVYTQSGVASWAFATASDTHPVQDTLALAKSNKCWDGSTDLVKLSKPQSHAIIDCLRNVDLNHSIANQEFSVFSKFSIVIDGVLIPQRPIELLKNPRYLKHIGFYDLSYFVGFNNNEKFLIDTSYQIVASFNNMSKEETNNLSRLDLQLSVNERLGKPKNNTVFFGKVFEWYNKRVTTPAFDAINDIDFIIPSFDFLNAVSRCHKGKGWLLYFNHYPARAKVIRRGIPHGIDLNYWLDREKLTIFARDEEFNDEDFQIRKMFQSLIGSFVKTGNPSSSRLNLTNGWPMYSKQGGEYLNFNIRPSVRSHLMQDKTEFWLRDFPKFVKSHRCN